ncbi:MAG: RagB/SusD family nutrient uptake outer membrane protein [Bacteroidales bacterium]|nr:RagB/SusD family nutrient uptake outer membrane protein [Bacteroidales bacterium]
MKTRKILNLLVASLLATLMLTTTSCKKAMDDQLTNRLTAEEVADLFADRPEEIRALVAGALGRLHWFYPTFFTATRHDVGSIMNVALSGDLMTEDMTQATFDWHYFDYEMENNMSTYARPSYTWAIGYAIIGSANEAIELVNPNTSNPILQDILGQALALRAFGYHMLIQRFQQTYKGNENRPGVPLIITAFDEGFHLDLSRGTVQNVYDLIERDLELAIRLLTANRPSKDFINKAVAQGLLARVKMCMHKWAEAEELAHEARSAFPIMSGTEAGGILDSAGNFTQLPYGFNNENNSEWMWGVKWTVENNMVWMSFQSHMASDGDGYAGLGSYKAMDNRLYEQMDTADVRRRLHYMNVEADLFYNTKFRAVPGWAMDNIYMRSSEMLLIEAEAQAQQGKNAQAATTLMELMNRRDQNYRKTEATVEDIFLQKRLELWGEGVIFYDYRRLKKEVNRMYNTPFNNHLEQVYASGTSWAVIYQIPRVEMVDNDFINDRDQNPATGNN